MFFILIKIKTSINSLYVIVYDHVFAIINVRNISKVLHLLYIIMKFNDHIG